MKILFWILLSDSREARGGPVRVILTIIDVCIEMGFDFRIYRSEVIASCGGSTLQLALLGFVETPRGIVLV